MSRPFLFSSGHSSEVHLLLGPACPLLFCCPVDIWKWPEINLRNPPTLVNSINSIDQNVTEKHSPFCYWWSRWWVVDYMAIMINMWWRRRRTFTTRNIDTRGISLPAFFLSQPSQCLTVLRVTFIAPLLNPVLCRPPSKSHLVYWFPADANSPNDFSQYTILLLLFLVWPGLLQSSSLLGLQSVSQSVCLHPYWKLWL